MIDLTDLEVQVGHWSDPVARTGCTAILLPPDTVASGEVRGGSPATREFDLLSPRAAVDAIDAIVLSGGSAFGLAAADGVVQWLEEHGRGYPTASGPVPIVVGMSLFDLAVGDPAVRPGASAGHRAASSATAQLLPGRIGAGTGATVNKWMGRDNQRDGGLGAVQLRAPAGGEGATVVVTAIVAVNAWGGLDDGSVRARIATGRQLDWPAPPGKIYGEVGGENTSAASGLRDNTTIGAVITNADLTKVACLPVASAAHHGLARALFPSHAQADGDAIVAAATGRVVAASAQVEMMAAVATEMAVRQAVK